MSSDMKLIARPLSGPGLADVGEVELDAPAD